MITKGNCSISCFVTIVYGVQISSTPRTLNTMSKYRCFLAKIRGEQIQTDRYITPVKTKVNVDFPLLGHHVQICS